MLATVLPSSIDPSLTTSTESRVCTLSSRGGSDLARGLFFTLALAFAAGSTGGIVDSGGAKDGVGETLLVVLDGVAGAGVLVPVVV